jgi:hypothetical protein
VGLENGKWGAGDIERMQRNIEQSVDREDSNNCCHFSISIDFLTVRNCEDEEKCGEFSTNMGKLDETEQW